MKLLFCLVLSTVALSAQPQLDFLNHGKPLLDAHNCYPYEGQWADRIDRALKVGLQLGYPVAIEQDIAWANGRVVVSHTAKTRGDEPTLKQHFFERVRPIVEEALKKNDRKSWPLIVVHFDFKDLDEQTIRGVWNVLGEYESWITTAPQTAGPHQLAKFDPKPLLVLTEDADEQEAVFFKAVPVGAKLRVFGSAHTAAVKGASREERVHLLATLPPEQLLVERPTNYRRWWNNSWFEVEEGGQTNAGDWTAADNARLRALVDRAHGLGYWIRFYTLDGFSEVESRGWDKGYNFGSREAAQARWKASYEAGVDLIATDQYEDLAAFVQQRDGSSAGGGVGGSLKVLARESLAKIDGESKIPGVREPVEIVRDKWGVTHIYAKNEEDLFFAQGYVAAQDRLWQLYMWRMEHEGRLAEILGPEAFERDRETRLLMYRGPFDDKEWSSYHPHGKAIFTAFANGINTFIKQNGNNLPVEFKLTGLKPDLWKPEALLLRVASFGDANAELTLARLVARIGVKEATKQHLWDPWSEIVVPDGLDLLLIGANVNTGRGGRGALPKPAIVAPYRAMLGGRGNLAESSIKEPGSNNWVIAGRNTVTGKPIVSNDPHRPVGNPSLRYIFHLVAPGWNVIGAQEPPFVGVALGHNERIAWGLTITGTDQTDTFVEEVNPVNPNEVKYNGKWEPLKIVREEIKVKGETPRTVELKISRHGPIFFEDTTNHRDYALKSVFNEPGTGSYLAGLRLDQSKDCKSFLDDAMYWKAPTENLNCGDVDGNIAIQSSALTPNRRGWDGRLPVPGTGKYEWDGFRAELPRRINPQEGYIATANNNINTTGYWPPVMFKTLNTVPTDRITRIEYLLNNLLMNRKFTVEDSEKLQHDAYSLRASYDIEIFKGWKSNNPEIEKARAMVADWDAVLRKDSIAAAVYETWRTTVDPKALEFYRSTVEKRPLAEAGLAKAVDRLKETQGGDSSGWRWGKMHSRPFPHPFVAAFDLPTIERDGGTGAVMADGASYREIMDTADWDRSVVTNVPGQSAQPESEFYGNLLPLWDRGEYFPMLYSRAKVNQNAAHKLTLRP